MEGASQLHSTLHYMRLVFVSDADMRKDGNYTCELLAHALNCLRDMNVPLGTEVSLHLQADNTCRENKNNLVMKFCAAITGFRCIDASEQDYLKSGHTHEDVDQWFGQLARFLLRHNRLQTPAEFVEVIQNFLSLQGQTTEVWAKSVKVDHVRDWNHWMGALDVHLAGIGGPGAPHRFSFRRRESYTAVEAIILVTPPRWEGMPPHPRDVFVTVWGCMSDPDNAPRMAPFLHVLHS